MNRSPFRIHSTLSHISVSIQIRLPLDQAFVSLGIIYEQLPESSELMCCISYIVVHAILSPCDLN